MNASWKPLSCPFMLVSVTVMESESGVEERRTPRGDDCEMRKQKTASQRTAAGGAGRTSRRAARPSIYIQRLRAPGSGPAPQRRAPMRH